MPADDDFIDGCEMPLHHEVTKDEDIDGIVLFCDLEGQGPEAIAKRKAEWEELFSGERH